MPNPRLSERGARWLVRLAARWIDASYNAYVRTERNQAPGWWDKPWAWMSRWVSRVALPLARKLDSEAATDEMINAGWWG